MVHVKLEPSKRVHTIHHHGMEPDPRNDGVGHTSFEVSGSYTYQWKPDRGRPGDPNKGAAGTYFYHCHVNTVLHVQMGMFGAADRRPGRPPGLPGAGGRAPVVRRRSRCTTSPPRRMLVPFAVDPRWHTLAHAAGLSGEDVGLNRFEPKFFYVARGLLNGPRRPPTCWRPRQLRANPPGTGHPTLLRMLDANYFPTRARFTDGSGQPVEMAELIAHDGRAFRDTSRPNQPSPPVRDTGHPLITDAIAFGAAERYDVLLHPPTRRDVHGALRLPALDHGQGAGDAEHPDHRELNPVHDDGRVSGPRAETALLMAVGVVAVSLSGPLMAAMVVPPLAIAFWRNGFATVGARPGGRRAAPRGARRAARPLARAGGGAAVRRSRCTSAPGSPR